MVLVEELIQTLTVCWNERVVETMDAAHWINPLHHLEYFPASGSVLVGQIGTVQEGQS